MKKFLLFFVPVALAAVLFVVALTLYRTDDRPEISREESGSLPSPAPVYFATMTHLEGKWLEAASDEDFFNQITQQLRFGMDLADAYDARLTFESEMPFALGMKKFNDNVFAEALKRGHGVGTHCDISLKKDYTTAELIREIKKRKALIDELVGAQNNFGCSGDAGHEWYEPMVKAGFHYLDGLVGGHYITMPLSERPPGWSDEQVLTTYWHSFAPQDEKERYYPFFVNSDADFKADEDGDLLVSAGDIGGALSTIAESDPVTGNSSCTGPCELTDEDVDELISRVKAFLKDRDTTRIAKLQVYLPSDIFVSENETVLRSFFSQLKALQDGGEIMWASQKEVYEAVLDWR